MKNKEIIREITKQTTKDLINACRLAKHIAVSIILPLAKKATRKAASVLWQATRKTCQYSNQYWKHSVAPLLKKWAATSSLQLRCHHRKLAMGAAGIAVVAVAITGSVIIFKKKGHSSTRVAASGNQSETVNPQVMPAQDDARRVTATWNSLRAMMPEESPATVQDQDANRASFKTIVSPTLSFVTTLSNTYAKAAEEKRKADQLEKQRLAKIKLKSAPVRRSAPLTRASRGDGIIGLTYGNRTSIDLGMGSGYQRQMQRARYNAQQSSNREMRRYQSHLNSTLRARGAR